MPEITIRAVDSLDGYHAVEKLQQEVWQFDERDIVPLAHLVAVKETGGILLGAYHESRMVGFVYGFVGYEDRSLIIHSHMLAVAKDWQGHNLGFRLKMAQRDQALRQGIQVVTWTFDPLQSLNAHLNISKLGVMAVAYRVNFYGETSSALHQGIGTDRLWVRWELDTERVRDRIAGDVNLSAEFEKAIPLVGSDGQGKPREHRADLTRAPFLSVEVPGNIGELQVQEPELARAWRKVTRAAFCRSFDEGYLVTDFHGGTVASGSHPTYLLSRELGGLHLRSH